MFERPEPTEYADYYGLYIGRVPEGDIRDLLASEIETTLELLRDIPARLETHRYAEEKWSVREVVGHMLDVERVFAFRALSFARRDTEPLPGMEQDGWALASNAHQRPLPELADELEAARRSHVAMFRGFDDEAALRAGVASGFRFTVRSIAYVLVGHEIHHRSVLAERYLD